MTNIPDWDVLYIAACNTDLSELRRQRLLAPNNLVARLELVAHLCQGTDLTRQDELVSELLWLVEHVDRYIWGRVGGVLAITNGDVHAAISPLLLGKASLPNATSESLVNAFLFHEHTNLVIGRYVIELALRQHPNVAYWWIKRSDLCDPLVMPIGEQLRSIDNAIRLQSNPNERSEYRIKRIQKSLDVDLKFAELVLNETLASLAEISDRAQLNRVMYQTEIIRGRILLRQGKATEAAQSLLAALHVGPQSGVQILSGPDLELARELYQVGVRVQVRDYVALCSGIFAKHAESLQEIVDALDEEREPQFVASRRRAVDSPPPGF